MDTKILNIAINPTGFGGVETFSRILNTNFKNSTTYCFKDRKDQNFPNAKYQLIKKNKIKTLLRLMKVGGSHEIYNAPDERHQIVIINAPCDLDNLPDKFLINNKVIYFAHSYPQHIWEHKNYFGRNRQKRLEKFRHIDRVVCLSEDYIEPFSRMLDIDPENVITVNHTVEIPPVIHSKKPHHKIITVCRLDNETKRLDRFIEIAALLPQYDFVIYGDGPDREKIRALAQHINNVFLAGPTGDIASAHMDAGIFLMTSSFEGFGITLIEALSQATPVVIAENSFSQAKVIIQHSYNGYVCDAYDPVQISNYIENIFFHYETFSRNALASFDRYGNKLFVEQWLKIFAELLAE